MLAPGARGRMVQIRGLLAPQHPSDGRVWVAVNGQVIVDHYGANYGVNNAPINRIMMPNLYSDTYLTLFTSGSMMWRYGMVSRLSATTLPMLPTRLQERDADRLYAMRERWVPRRPRATQAPRDCRCTQRHP